MISIPPQRKGLGPNPAETWNTACDLSVLHLFCTCQDSMAQLTMKLIPPAGEPTGMMHINNTQHPAQLQNWSQGLDLGFLYCSWLPHSLHTPNPHTNPFHLVINQDIPDELLTLLFLLKVLLHFSPVVCSALCNSQCSLNLSRKDNDLGFKQENSSELGRLFCILSKFT